ncbi:basic salivary proline-rich protein 2-like [Equus asinus]|uniref:basic salivary proline-rich protein 2-like n=1 Tax=Equus asinus TaxID=9793 RepID=UPI0038F5F9DA
MSRFNATWEVEEEEPPNPHPRSHDSPKCPPNTAPLRGPRRGRWKSPAHPLPGKFSGVTPAPRGRHLRRPPGARRERGRRAGGAPSRDPAPPGDRASSGHPHGAQPGAGGGGGGDGRPALRVPTARVKCSALPLPAPTAPGQRGSIRRGPPAPRPPPRAPRGPDPTRDPRIRTPDSGLGARQARRALLTPHSPRRRRRAPGGRAPPSSRRDPPPPASAGRTCARRRRRRRRSPAPFACAGAAPNPTHIATHSPLTSPSPRPAHVTAETHGFPQTPPPSPAARGRARAAGRGRGGARSQRRPRARGPAGVAAAAVASKLAVPQGRARRLAYGGSSGLPPPRRLARAPLPQARARRSWPRAPSGRLARGAVCGALGADRMFPPHPTPTATRPPSFLESPSRLSGAATAPPPPPPHPLLCGDGPDPGAPWPLGRRAPRERGQGGRAVHCARPQQPAGPGRGRGRGRGPPAERRRPRSGAGDPPPAGRSWAAPPRRQPGGGRPAAPPGWALLAGAAPRPRGASRPRPAPPAACAPPRPAQPGRLPRLTSLRHRAGPEAGQSSGETERNIFVPTSQPRFPSPPPSDCPLGSKGSWKSHVSTVFTEGFGGFVLEENTR